MGYLYVFLTISFTVYGQLVLKWRMNLKGQLPVEFSSKIKFMFNAYLDPWILSGFLVAFLASVTWSMAMTKFELSKVYPFMSLSYLIVFILSVFLFNESVNIGKIAGFILIVVGVFVVSKSQ
jgi:multidrug transporter EmrE-like cation transporter